MWVTCSSAVLLLPCLFPGVSELLEFFPWKPDCHWPLGRGGDPRSFTRQDLTVSHFGVAARWAHLKDVMANNYPSVGPVLGYNEADPLPELMLAIECPPRFCLSKKLFGHTWIQANNTGSLQGVQSPEGELSSACMLLQLLLLLKSRHDRHNGLTMMLLLSR